MADPTLPYDGPVVTREEASALGQKRYFTGTPCPANHVAQRYTSRGSCVACLDDYRRTNRELTNARTKRWWDAHPDYRSPNYEQNWKRSGENRKRRLRDDPQVRERFLAKKREQRARHRRKIAEARKRVYRERHAEIRAYYKRYNDENRQAVLASKSKWKKKNPEKVLAATHTRQARKAGAGGVFTVDDIHEIRRLQKGRCAICRAKLGKKAHIDHIIALASGGSNDRRNLQLAHPRCNLEKGDKDPIDFMRSRGFLL